LPRVHETEPAESAAAQSQLPIESPGGAAGVGPALADREGDLKVSANRGADLLVCLVAVKHGRRDCPDGLPFLQSNAARLGRRRKSPSPSTAQAPTTAIGSTQLRSPHSCAACNSNPTALRSTRPADRRRRRSLATLGKGTPSVGKIQAKPGNRVGFTTPTLGIAGASNMAGFIQARSGRKLVFANLINNIPLTGAALPEVFSIFDDQQLINGAFQQAY
jgi:D-alanyl-D-alanine carboxypeptidase/D-alanyl-D-alanine-endopeptidase (penicillin-binding protein 4)